MPNIKVAGITKGRRVERIDGVDRIQVGRVKVPVDNMVPAIVAVDREPVGYAFLDSQLDGVIDRVPS